MPDDLAFWLMSQNSPLVSIRSSAPRRSSGDYALRLKNRSASYIATAITLSLDGPSAVQYLISIDAGFSFAATADIGDLAPTAISDSIWLRRVTPSGTALGAHTCTLRATPASWLPWDTD